MTTLTVTTRGQIIFNKDICKHLGILRGEKIELQLLPNGEVLIRCAKPASNFNDLAGILQPKNRKNVTIDEMNETTARGWAGKL